MLRVTSLSVARLTSDMTVAQGDGLALSSNAYYMRLTKLLRVS